MRRTRSDPNHYYMKTEDLPVEYEEIEEEGKEIEVEVEESKKRTVIKISLPTLENLREINVRIEERTKNGTMPRRERDTTLPTLESIYNMKKASGDASQGEETRKDQETDKF